MCCQANYIVSMELEANYKELFDLLKFYFLFNRMFKQVNKVSAIVLSASFETKNYCRQEKGEKKGHRKKILELRIIFKKLKYYFLFIFDT
jgi:hypothetical protein